MNLNDDGISILLGDPEKAIKKLLKPMILSMLVLSLYSFINSVWVSDLGVDNLSAIGFVIPIFTIFVGFTEGLTVGAISTISRFIGAEKKEDMNNAVWHVIFLAVIFAVIFSILMFIFLKPILLLSGADSVIDLSMGYGNILFYGALFFIFNNAIEGIFIGKGDTKKIIYLSILSFVINFSLDPIFIYGLNWGINGAAIATVISVIIVSIFSLYFLNKDNYIDFSLKNFNYNVSILKDILNESIPAGSELILLGVMEIVLERILEYVGGNEGVAIYSVGFEVVSLFIIPLSAMSFSSVSVMGVAFGSNKLKKLRHAKNYITKLGFLITILISIVTFCFAPYISHLFTSPYNADYLVPLISDLLRIMCLYYLTLPLATTAESFFQSMGKGINSFIMIFLREVLLVIIFSYFLAIFCKWGTTGVWWGIVIGNLIGVIIAYLWSEIYIKHLIGKSISS
jgi:putative MATE family efflux protein